MDKREIIKRLNNIAEHAAHTVGEEPFVMSLDDGIAVHEAVELLKKSETNCSEFPNNSDTISRQAVTKFLNDWLSCLFENCHKQSASDLKMIIKDFKNLPSVQPTLYGYNIDHLELIARVLQKENLPPERVAEALIDIGGIVAIVSDEFEETLRKAVEECTKNM